MTIGVPIQTAVRPTQPAGGPIQTAAGPVAAPAYLIHEGREGPAWRAGVEARLAALEAVFPLVCATQSRLVPRITPPCPEPEALPGPAAGAEPPQFTVRPDGHGGLLLVYLSGMAWTLSPAEAGRLGAELRRTALLVQQAAGEVG